MKSEKVIEALAKSAVDNRAFEGVNLQNEHELQLAIEDCFDVDCEFALSQQECEEGQPNWGKALKIYGKACRKFLGVNP